MRTYFEKPTQVAFWDSVLVKYVSGVAFRDYIICGDNGSVIAIKALTNREEWPLNLAPLVEYEHWVNLDRYILDVEEENA